VQVAREVNGGSCERMAPNLTARALNSGRDRSGESVGSCLGQNGGTDVIAVLKPRPG
jgi:hypothetical protein